jgi:hypothetical protein
MAEVAQTFLANPYSAEARQLQQQQKLAEILQSQAAQPDQKFSYGGIEAPPSAAAAIAKGLQGGVAGYLMGRSMSGEKKLAEKASADAETFINSLSGSDGKTLAGDELVQSLRKGIVSGNPMIQGVAGPMYAKALEKTTLKPGEQVFNSSGEKLFGVDPTAKYGTTPQNIARNPLSKTGWSGLIVDGNTGDQKMIDVLPPRDMTDLTLNQTVEAGQRGATIGQAGQKLNYETGMTPAMPPAVQGAPVPPGIPPQGSAPQGGMPQGAQPRPGSVVPNVSAPGAPQRPSTVSVENPLIKNVPPKEAQALLAEQPAANQAASVISSTIDNHIKQIDDLLNQKGFNDIFGTVAGRTFNFTDKAGNAQAAFDAVAGQAAVQALNEMRAASKTGGAVGNVTEKEWPILQAQMAALAQTQDPAQMRANLAKLKDTYSRIKATANQAYSSVYGETPRATMSIDDLLAKYGGGK